MDLIGKFIMVKTKTKGDNFGDCLYQITGPIIERDTMAGKHKIIRCEMLGGTGKAARSGMTIWDPLDDLVKAIETGVTHRVVPAAEATALINSFSEKNKLAKPGNVIEM